MNIGNIDARPEAHMEETGWQPIAIVSGNAPLPPGRKIADVARPLQAGLNALVQGAHGNRAEMLPVLKT